MDHVRESGADELPLANRLDEFEYLRRTNAIAINNMTEEAAAQTGTASGVVVSFRALIHILVGHVEHRMENLREKYLPNIV